MNHSHIPNVNHYFLSGSPFFAPLFALGLLVIGSLISPNNALADEILKKAATAACDNIKMCISKQIGNDENIPPAMHQMINGLAKEACNGLYQMHQKLDQKQYYMPILQCYQAMSKISCKDLENKVQAQACEKLDDAL